MNIEEILKQLEDSIKEPVLIGDDYYTGEGWETPNFFCLDPTTNDCKILYEYITKLQTNWNELKKFINSGYYDSYIYSSTILNKMRKLEGENNNEEESNSQ